MADGITVRVPKTKKTKDKIGEIFVWNEQNTSGSWGTSWWTIYHNDYYDFVFLNENDATLFALKWT